MIDNIFTFNADKNEWLLDLVQLRKRIVETLGLGDSEVDTLKQLFRTDHWLRYIRDLHHEYIEPAYRGKKLTEAFLKELTTKIITVFGPHITYIASEQPPFHFDEDNALKAYRAARKEQDLPEPLEKSIPLNEVHAQVKSLKEKHAENQPIEADHWLNAKDFADILLAADVKKNTVKIIALDSLDDSLKRVSKEIGNKDTTVPLLINSKNNHWLQAIITIKNATVDIAIKDSGNPSTVQPKLEQAFKKAFSGKKVNFRYPRTDKQLDTWSCGYRAVTSLLQDLKVKVTPTIQALYKAKSSNDLRDAIFALLGIPVATQTTEIIPLDITEIFGMNDCAAKTNQLLNCQNRLEKNLKTPCSSAKQAVATKEGINRMNANEDESDSEYATRLQLAEINLYLHSQQKSP